MVSTRVRYRLHPGDAHQRVGSVVLDRRTRIRTAVQRAGFVRTVEEIAGYSSRMGAAAVWAGAEYAERFFMGTADVQQAMRKLVAALDELEIPYAIVGGMALNEYGYQRVTVDVDVLLTQEGLQRFKDHWLGRGYVERFPGSRGLRDAELGVMIDVLVTGDYPGDGKPKPVQFPDPAKVAIRARGLALVPLATLIELKLASGMTTIHRAKDIGDVVELIKRARPQRALGDELDPSVRERYFEIWDALQAPDPMQE
jgi:hypothetical protein